MICRWIVARRLLPVGRELAVLNAPRMMRLFMSAAVSFYCGREHSSAHTALGDVTATLDVFEAQLERYPDLPHSPKELDQCVRRPEDVDRLGKLRWVNGLITVAFGRYKGRTLKYLSREDPDYIHWMIENDVVADAVHHLRDAVMGIFSNPPPELAPKEDD